MIGVIGSTNIDIVLKVSHFTIEGETQKCESHNIYFGGKGANQAVAAAKISKVPVYFCTNIGKDGYGEKIISHFDTFNIEGYSVDETISTGQAFIEVNDDGENRIIIYDGANKNITPDKINNFLNIYKEKFQYCLLQNEIPRESIEFAIQELKKAGKVIIYDPAPKELTNINLLRDIDFITPNETEFEYIYNLSGLNTESDPIKKALNFKNHSGVKNLILKLGSEGLIYIDEKNQIIRIGSYKVDAVDTTAAGDIFNGSFISALVSGKNVEDSLRYAAAGAAISVTRNGAQTSIPTKEEIEEFIKKQG